MIKRALATEEGPCASQRLGGSGVLPVGRGAGGAENRNTFTRGLRPRISGTTGDPWSAPGARKARESFFVMAKLRGPSADARVSHEGMCFCATVVLSGVGKQWHGA